MRLWPSGARPPRITIRPKTKAMLCTLQSVRRSCYLNLFGTRAIPPKTALNAHPCFKWIHQCSSKAMRVQPSGLKKRIPLFSSPSSRKAEAGLEISKKRASLRSRGWGNIFRCTAAKSRQRDGLISGKQSMQFCLPYISEITTRACESFVSLISINMWPSNLRRGCCSSRNSS